MLPTTEHQMIEIPNEKRTADDEPKYVYAENSCDHAWHTNARESSMQGMNAAHAEEESNRNTMEEEMVSN